MTEGTLLQLAQHCGGKKADQKSQGGFPSDQAINTNHLSCSFGLRFWSCRIAKHPGLTAILVPDSNIMEDRTPLWHNVVTWPPGISVSCPPEPHMRRTRAVSLRPLGACCLLDKGLL